MGLVTVFCPLLTNGASEFVLQSPGESRLVVDCKVKPMALVDQVKTTFALEGMMISCAGDENRLVGSVEASHSCQLSTPSPSGSAPSVKKSTGRLNCCNHA